VDRQSLPSSCLRPPPFPTRRSSDLYAYVPYGSLESVIENSKEGYYLALRQTQSTIRTDSPNWQPWLQFFLRALHQQMRRLAVKVDRKSTRLNSSHVKSSYAVFCLKT